MLKDFFSLALQSTLRKKRSSILVFLVLLFSFSCAITTLSLTKSISDTNAEFRLNTYGEWYVVATRSTPEDGEWLSSQSWAKNVVHNRMYSNVDAFEIEGFFGIIDQDFLDMGHSKMVAGRLPEKKGEIALSEKALEQLDIRDYKIGEEEIHINVLFLLESGFGEGKELNATLCGVFEDIDDLWTVTYQPNIKIAVTEETITEHYNNTLKSSNGLLAVPKFYEQYYVTVDKDGRAQAQRDVFDHEFAPLKDGKPQAVDINYASYPAGQDAVSDEELYSYLVAVVALIAIICVYILQLPEQVHSFAVLRSIGITKRQLLLLAFIESMLLAIPAIILGIPVGAFLTKIALKLTMYSGSVEVKVAIPYGMLWKLFALWIGIILFSRLVIFLITIRTPLTGRMQMSTSTARKSRALRTATIALMLLIFSTATAFSLSSSARPKDILEWNSTVPDYRISNHSAEFPLTPEKVELVASIPGISRVEAFIQGSSRDDPNEISETLLMSYTGVERMPVCHYYLLEEDYWDDALHFGEYKEAFHNGDIVFLYFGSNPTKYEIIHGAPPVEIYPAEGEKITLHAQSIDGSIVAEDSVDVVVKQLTRDAETYSRGWGLFESNTIVFSEAYFKKFVSKINSKSAKWGGNIGKGPYGLGGIIAMADISSDDLSAGVAIKAFCKSNDLDLDDRHEELITTRQAHTQELIKLFACGGCVVLVALLLFGGALSLEAESEKRSYSILRAIGMSRRQVRRKVFSKALVRSVLAVACGWGLTFALGIWKNIQLQEQLDLAGASADYFSALEYYRFGINYILPISIACIVILLAVSVMVKRRLWKKQFSIKE